MVSLQTKFKFSIFVKSAILDFENAKKPQVLVGRSKIIVAIKAK